MGRNFISVQMKINGQAYYQAMCPFKHLGTVVVVMQTWKAAKTHQVLWTTMSKYIYANVSKSSG